MWIRNKWGSLINLNLAFRIVTAKDHEYYRVKVECSEKGYYIILNEFLTEEEAKKYVDAIYEKICSVK